ncbi:MAG: CoA ester lyase [Pseudomonadales bacterium]
MMDNKPAIRPRRSVLYMPASNMRAMDKARSLAADCIVFDLEDAVDPDAKQQAREQLLEALAQGGYGERELIVRVNALGTPWGVDDLVAVAQSGAHSVCLPKVESVAYVRRVADKLAEHGAPDMGIWVMAETPAGIQNIDEIAAAHDQIDVILMGTSDLAKELRVPHTPERTGFLYSLSRCIIAARANGLDAIDGVYLDLEDTTAYEAICQQGRELGFDGKSLIHPKQIDCANAVFGPSSVEIAHSRRVLEVWQKAEAAGTALAVLDGKLVEILHAEEAERVLLLADSVARMSAL